MENKKVSGGSQYSRFGQSHYQRNREDYIQKAAERRRKNAEYIRSVKEKIGCADCGTHDWRVLDFDHLPGEKKEGNLASPKVQSWGKARIDAEIAKCEVVCSNCHRIRTFTRMFGVTLANTQTFQV